MYFWIMNEAKQIRGFVESRFTSHESRLLRFLTFLTISLLLLCPAATVLAEDGRTNTYIRMEETEIIGIVEHPEITYIIPKTRIRFSRIPLERDFSSRATRLMNPMALLSEIRVKTALTGTLNSAE